MEHQRVGVAQATGAQRPRHGGADAAAHPARRHGLHQHDQRKDEGHAGQRVDAKPAEKVGFAGVHRRLDGHDDDVGCGQAQQGPRDRALEEEAGLIGHWERDGRADGRGDGGGPDSATRHRSPRRKGRPPHADQPVVAGHVDVPRRMTREPVPSAVATGGASRCAAPARRPGRRGRRRPRGTPVRGHDPGAVHLAFGRGAVGIRPRFTGSSSCAFRCLAAPPGFACPCTCMDTHVCTCNDLAGQGGGW